MIEEERIELEDERIKEKKTILVRLDSGPTTHCLENTFSDDNVTLRKFISGHAFNSENVFLDEYLHDRKSFVRKWIFERVNVHPKIHFRNPIHMSGNEFLKCYIVVQKCISR